MGYITESEKLARLAVKDSEEQDFLEGIYRKFSKKCPFCKGRGHRIFDKAELLKHIMQTRQVGKSQAYRLLKTITKD